jgi:hypothetical protein
MASRLIHLKNTVATAYARQHKPTFYAKCYAGAGTLVAGTIITDCVYYDLITEFEINKLINQSSTDTGYNYNHVKVSRVIKSGLTTILETAPMAVICGIVWPAIMIRVMLDYYKYN